MRPRRPPRRPNTNDPACVMPNGGASDAIHREAAERAENTRNAGYGGKPSSRRKPRGAEDAENAFLNESGLAGIGGEWQDEGYGGGGGRRRGWRFAPGFLTGDSCGRGYRCPPRLRVSGDNPGRGRPATCIGEFRCPARP